jgi:hypothetical protein
MGMLLEHVAQRLDWSERRGLILWLLFGLFVGLLVRVVLRLFVGLVVRRELDVVRLLRSRHRRRHGEHVLRVPRTGWRHRRGGLRRGHRRRVDLGVDGRVPGRGPLGVLRDAAVLAVLLQLDHGAVALHVERRDVVGDEPVRAQGCS